MTCKVVDSVYAVSLDGVVADAPWVTGLRFRWDLRTGVSFWNFSLIKGHEASAFEEGEQINFFLFLLEGKRLQEVCKKAKTEGKT